MCAMTRSNYPVSESMEPMLVNMYVLTFQRKVSTGRCMPHIPGHGCRELWHGWCERQHQTSGAH